MAALLQGGRRISKITHLYSRETEALIALNLYFCGDFIYIF